MKSKSFINVLGSVTNLQYDMLFTKEDEEICKTSSISSPRRPNRSLDDFQIFSDHLKLKKRFKKTLYYANCTGLETGSSLPLYDATLELFTKTVPNGGLGVLDMNYVASISWQASISPCSMILAIMYLDQLRHKNPEYLQNVSSCDLLVISMLVASKFLYDCGEEGDAFNKEWAWYTNMDIRELNKLEGEFLAAINWEVFVKSSEFFQVAREVECKIALNEASKHGWFTYTEIFLLSQKFVPVRVVTILVGNVLKVIVITAVAYMAAVWILFGASVICQLFIAQGTFQVDVKNTSGCDDDNTPGTSIYGNMSCENFIAGWRGRMLPPIEQNETDMLSGPSAFVFHEGTEQYNNDHHKFKICVKDNFPVSVISLLPNCLWLQM